MEHLELRRGGDDAPGPGKEDPGSAQGSESGGLGVRCPKCGWRPRAQDRWSCVCGHVWNTFDTHGRCPACSRQWMETACIACSEWSPHVDWYEKDPGFSA